MIANHYHLDNAPSQDNTMQATLTSSSQLNPANNLGMEALAHSQRESAAAQINAATVQSEDLLQGKKAVEINHNGAIYRLQATKLGKLILTK
jgi:hemin uptake protein HemP